MPIVKVLNLTKKIKNKEIVKDVNLEINKGEIVGFLGPNGSGKTTVMKMIVGLISISSGEVIINGHNIVTEKEEALKYVSGFIEYPELYKFMTGFDNLVHFQRILGPVNKEDIARLADLVGLKDALHQKVKTYSLGMKQRLGIAQALLSSPEVLILDEPTNGLDPAGIIEIREYLLKIAKEQNISIFISSHLLNEMEILCDRLIYIHKGEIIDDQKNIETERERGKVTFSLHVTPTELAKEVLKDVVIDINTQQQTIIIQSYFGDIPFLIKKLVEHDLMIYSVSPQSSSLESKYLAKISGDY
ncbi:ABC transporter ATP-binding protein (plasmid) [Niallia taxi]|uniref:ABC transporter ATP-binding protein n=1 Tax=Niallia taxi TaxID=2499688 RepID=UPI0029343180|nr:ABC transporter ATP-binding protein [Niallia taxi]WOD65276.1 ABC transporter ATP-binding protein [Niallia taxi]